MLALLLVVRFVPCWWCGREAGAWYRGNRALQLRLARGVRRYTERELDAGAFSTGSHRFDGEWLFGTYFMAGMGFAQVALEHPELRAEVRPALRRCIARLLTPRVQAFDVRAWGQGPLDGIGRADNARGHAAYLGYLNLLLGLDRALDPGTHHAALHDRLTAVLAGRIARAPQLLMETYPGEVYPVDNAAVAASIGLHDRVTGRADHRALLSRWAARLRAVAVDRRTGLLIQRVDGESGAPADVPRGSGTALASYFLSFSHPRLSRALYRALRRTLSRQFLGFGAVREYPPRVSGRGDIDSGPVLLGVGLSATGFAIAPARIHRDAATFRRLVATATLFGAPRGGRALTFLTGGPLGNAILFAMLTAPLPGRIPAPPRGAP